MIDDVACRSNPLRSVIVVLYRVVCNWNKQRRLFVVRDPAFKANNNLSFLRLLSLHSKVVFFRSKKKLFTNS